MRKLYTVKRDKICVGKVIGNFELLSNGRNLLGDSMEFGDYTPYRSMMFIPTTMGTAEDLLYSSPQYPIHKMCEDEVCRDSKIIIKDAHNIGKLLKALGYEEEVDYFDVAGIRNRYFNRLYSSLNYEKFGLVEVDIEEQIANELLGKNLTPEEIKKFTKLRNFQHFWGLRNEFTINPELQEFNPSDIEKVYLPIEYFKILREFGDKSIFEYFFGYADKMNAFKPHKEEGPIRSLKKYDLN